MYYVKRILAIFLCYISRPLLDFSIHLHLIMVSHQRFPNYKSPLPQLRGQNMERCTIGTRTDQGGTIYKTRMVATFSADGTTYTELMEYSADDGKTWATVYRAKMTRVSR